MRKEKRGLVPFLLISILFVIYIVLLFKLTIFRGSYPAVQNVNLIPFSTIIEYILSVRAGNRVVGMINLLGNLIAFMPLGYLTASLLPGMRKTVRILITAASLSVFIEASQYVLSCGSADVDDVILNAAGGVFGYWIYAFMSYHFAKISKMVQPGKAVKLKA